MSGRVGTGRSMQELRLASGCCPAEMAERAGCSRAVVMAVEDGIIDAPRRLLEAALRMVHAGPGRVVIESEMRRLYGE